VIASPTRQIPDGNSKHSELGAEVPADLLNGHALRSGVGQTFKAVLLAYPLGQGCARRTPVAPAAIQPPAPFHSRDRAAMSRWPGRFRASSEILAETRAAVMEPPWPLARCS